ncbi:MAG: tetratricopeptide repeat protein [Cytophagales bacterium]
MNKKQWLLIGAAILLLVFLYSLPKIIIDNETDEIAELEEEKSDSLTRDENPMEGHSILSDSLYESRVEKFKSAFQLAENKKKKSIFADSLAQAYSKMRDFDNAIKFGKQALELNETSGNRENLANIYYEAMTFSLNMDDAGKMGTQARELMQGLLEEQPRRFDLMNKMAMTYVVSEAPMKGIMMLREVLEKDPNNIDAIFNLGILSIQSGQYDKGIERFVKLTQIDSSNVRAWYYLGLCLKETGKAEEAKQALAKASTLDADPEVQASINALLKEL